MRLQGVLVSERGGARYGNRKRIGPRANAGSTRPFCVTTSSPRAAIRRAAARTGSIKSRQPSAVNARAASEGQMLEPRCRSASRPVIVRSIAAPVAPSFVVLQRSLQYRTFCQQRAHFRRHANRLPQLSHSRSSALTKFLMSLTLRPSRLRVMARRSSGCAAAAMAARTAS